MGKSQEFYVRAKKIIPGGTQLLSKRPEMFLPDLWPSYYKKAKGCEVWDLDGNKYFDFACMGVGSCTLGYADDDINNAVIKALSNGSMCTLNSYEEVELAEKLIELHPWAEMVRFARTGGEACSIAVRIARAATGRDKVLFCGYHGWHDWYLSANLGDNSKLDEQLLPGLKPSGVVRNLKNTALPFLYNNLNSLEKVVEENAKDVAAIIMEPRRGEAPTDEFLLGVRKIASKIGAVLIFDEVTSGFRVNIGGIHKTMCVNPDMAVFGKALGNGYAISAVIGIKNVMEASQHSFISSTFWTERLGYVAALETLKKMEKINSTKQLIIRGDEINECWKTNAAKYGIKINITGISPLTHINFEYNNALEIQTLYTQIMLQKGFLLGASVYSTVAYNDDIIQKFNIATDEAFREISNAIESDNITSKLKGRVKHNGFKRLVY